MCIDHRMVRNYKRKPAREQFHNANNFIYRLDKYLILIVGYIILFFLFGSWHSQKVLILLQEDQEWLQTVRLYLM
jgi:hypothetical protein